MAGVGWFGISLPRTTYPEVFSQLQARLTGLNSWFTVNMGTGVVSILLYGLPYNARWLYWLSVIVFCLNVTLFALFTVLSMLRYILWPEIWRAMVHHPIQSLFIGTFPIALSTIINMIVDICIPAWGSWVTYTAWGLWIVDAVLSVIISCCVPFMVMKEKDESILSTITGLQILPFAAPVVASVSSGIVAGALKEHPHQALATVLAGYLLWGLGFPMAVILMFMYYQRLVVHKLPSRQVIVSVFILIGPPSLGAYAVLELGYVAMDVFPKTNTIHPLAGVILYNIGVLIALICWGFAALWFFFAVATIVHCKTIPFNLGWWGYVLLSREV